MKIFVLTILLTLGAQLSFAQTSSRPPRPKGTSKAKMIAEPNTFLWEISGNGMAKPSYLFGTMHTLCEEYAVLREGVKKAIANADGICFELDHSKQAEMAGSMQLNIMKNNTRLEDLISKAAFDRVKKFVETNKLMISYDILNHFKPLFILSIFGDQTMTCPRKSMEMMIMAEAKQYGKPISGLETIEYQTSLFDSLSYKKQAELLVQGVDSFHLQQNHSQRLMEIYKEQNLQRMDSIIHVGTQEPFPKQIMELVTDNRNKNWSHDIFKVNQAGNKSIFFGVGAAHLVGKKGVIALLKEKGYTLKPILD